MTTKVTALMAAAMIVLAGFPLPTAAQTLTETDIASMQIIAVNRYEGMFRHARGEGAGRIDVNVTITLGPAGEGLVIQSLVARPCSPLQRLFPRSIQILTAWGPRSGRLTTVHLSASASKPRALRVARSLSHFPKILGPAHSRWTRLVRSGLEPSLGSTGMAKSAGSSRSSPNRRPASSAIRRSIGLVC